MKNIIITLFFIPLILFSQNLEDPQMPDFTFENGLIVYKRTMDVDSCSKAELNKRAKKWILETFKFPEKVIVYEDSNSIRITSNFRVKQKSSFFNIYYLLTIHFKDNKYRYELHNIEYSPATGPYTGKYGIEALYNSTFMVKRFTAILVDVDTELKSVLLSLSNGMKKDSIDEW